MLQRADPSLTSGLELRLFGSINVTVNGESLPHLRSRKGLWLLALLALRGGRDVDRDWLAGTLWPNCDEAHGRRSLRQSLHDLRAALGQEAWRIKSEEPKSLRLDVAGVFVDALEFDRAAVDGKTQSLESAVSLYRGPLLEDCTEDWALEARRQREQIYLRTLERLATEAANREAHGSATTLLRSAIAVDPFREDLQRSLMESLSADGSPAAALLVYRQYRALLGREMAGEPDAETTAVFQRLKNESRAVPKVSLEVASNSHDGRADNAAHGQARLPIPLTALIGRESEVREVTALASSSRLITLTGSGGVGKTRLAIQIAKQLCAGFEDGAVFVDLSSLEDPDLVPDVVRAALGAPVVDGTQDPLDLVCSYLSNRRILLVLDNCEHLGRSCGSLAETLLRRCDGVKILATSRHVLGVKGENVWRVPSFAVPKSRSSKAIAISEIRRESTYQDYAAIRLFAERARSSESTFKITPKSALSMVKICSLLDGIPLAIELAAARVKALRSRRSPTD